MYIHKVGDRYTVPLSMLEPGRTLASGDEFDLGSMVSLGNDEVPKTWRLKVLEVRREELMCTIIAMSE